MSTFLRGKPSPPGLNSVGPEMGMAGREAAKKRRLFPINAHFFLPMKRSHRLFRTDVK